MRGRPTYLVLAIATVIAGLTVHLHGTGLPAALRDILGDALWAAMIFWLVSLAAPTVTLSWRAFAALAICFAVELSQLLEHPVLEAVRGSTLGHLVIGSDFDARDLVAYGGGIVAAALLGVAFFHNGRSPKPVE
jgi:hypothetical protein